MLCIAVVSNFVLIWRNLAGLELTYGILEEHELAISEHALLGFWRTVSREGNQGLLGMSGSQ